MTQPFSQSSTTNRDEQVPVVFSNRQGVKLMGILHTPAQPADLGVILLSPGIKMRVGPECLYRRITTMFMRFGIPVFRFDFYGLGDSEGTIQEEYVKDVYNHIEVGRFVDDAVDAMNWMQAHCGTKRFILAGLCGGAITGLLAGSRDERVAGLLALGITPVLASRAADPSLYMTSGQLAYMRGAYFRKLLRPSAWLRFLTLKSDMRVLWKSMTHGVRRRRGTPEASASSQPVIDNASPLFPPAFFRMLSSGRRMLLIFGGSDRLRWEFEEKFVARHRERLEVSAPYELHVIEDANHVLSFAEWQREMLEVSSRWVEKHFGQAIVRQDHRLRRPSQPQSVFD
jgi:pimeloyl-ACP methyl ester carboxylesterase